MPLAPQRLSAKPRFDVLFLVAMGCLVLTFSMLNLKSEPQVSSYFIKLEKPSIRYGPYRGNNNKRTRILEKEASPSRDRERSRAQADASAARESPATNGIPELLKTEYASIETNTTHLQLEEGADAIKQEVVKGSSAKLTTNKKLYRATVAHSNPSSPILNDGSRLPEKNIAQANVNISSTILDAVKRSNDILTVVNEHFEWAPKGVVNAVSAENATSVDDRKQERADTLETGSEAAKSSYYPTYFQHDVPLEKLMSRGNLLRVYSGCSIAAWSFSGWTEEEESRLNDCYLDKGYDALMMHQVTIESASQVQPFDSIYVPIASLERFVANVLPKIQNDFILLTGQKSLVPPFSRELFDTIIEHPRVTHWFLQNQAMYSYNNSHPKMGIFPYGLYTKYPENYLAEMKRKVQKDNFIYVGYLNKGTNKKVRRDIPRQRHKIPPPLYFSGLRNSTYVLSPDGDRPECHRHYEAIGLGTVPVTGLDPYKHRHLIGNAVFDEQRWKLDELEAHLPRNPKVNQRLVFEEYWMEYFEREMGRPLRWWDPSRNVRCSLAEIVNEVKRT